MRYLFLVQGEGRGHMTQAMVLSDILNRNGHEVVHTFIGQSPRREIPAYFFNNINSPVEALPSPNFILTKNNKSLNLWKSIIFNAMQLRTFKRSLRRIHGKILESNPDALINFCDILGGFYFRFYNPKYAKHICIGRHFLTNHPKFPFASGRPLEKWLFLLHNALTGQRCYKYLALSFREYDPLKVKKTIVMPPLIKKEVRNAMVSNENFILGYIVNDGYAQEVIDWHMKNQSTTIHCFWDRKDMSSHYSPHANLTFHQLDSVLFGEMMRQCNGFITTAGFESICEAMYLNKPVLMIPVDNQYEQACNAVDAVISGAGLQSDTFDVSLLLEYEGRYPKNSTFQNWVANADSRFLEELTNLHGSHGR